MYYTPCTNIYATDILHKISGSSGYFCMHFPPNPTVFFRFSPEARPAPPPPSRGRPWKSPPIYPQILHIYHRIPHTAPAAPVFPRKVCRRHSACPPNRAGPPASSGSTAEVRSIPFRFHASQHKRKNHLRRARQAVPAALRRGPAAGRNRRQSGSSPGPFSRKVVIPGKIENLRQFDGNPDSLLKFLMLPDFLLVFLNLGDPFLAGFLPRFRHG